MNDKNGNGGNGNGPSEQLPPNGNSNSKTAKWIGDCIKPLENEIQAAGSLQQISCLAFEEQKMAGNLRICRIVDARKVLQEYEAIHGCVSLGLSAHITSIQSNTTDYLTHNEELGTNLTTCLEAVNAVKEQMKKVWEKACALDAARKDSCYSDALSALGELPAESEGGPAGLERFNAAVDDIRDTVNALNDRTDDVFEKGIKYAGVQAFMNVAGLEQLVQDLAADIQAFHDDVIENQGDLAAALTQRWEEYSEGVATATEKWSGKRSSTLDYDMLDALKQYLESSKSELDELTELACNKDLDQLKTALEGICSTVQDTFMAGVNCSPGPNGGSKNQFAQSR